MEGSTEFKLASGATLAITVAPFVDAKRLQNEIFRALAGQSLQGMEMFALAMKVGASEPVEAAFFKCAGRALYSADGTETSVQKVTPALFDDPNVGVQARADYYDIFAHVVEVNVKPFIVALFSKSGSLLPVQKNTGSPQ